MFVVDYIFNWVEEKATGADFSKILYKYLLGHILSRFRVPKVLISDKGTHFCSHIVAPLLGKYAVTHKIFTLFTK